MRTKEEIIEDYVYEIQEKFEWSLNNEDFNSDDIEKILEEMYEEINNNRKDNNEKSEKRSGDSAHDQSADERETRNE